MDNSIAEHTPPGWLVGLLRSCSKSAWFGALSFETRCHASLSQVHSVATAFSDVVVFDYPTTATPMYEDRARRRANRVVLEGLAAGSRYHEVEVAPYSYTALHGKVQDALDTLDPEYVVFDVTCLTKVHAVALATFLAGRSSPRWALAYSTPVSYGRLEEPQKRHGWRDVLLAPLGDGALLSNEHKSRGIVLAGHEADRLAVGLAEIEASGGVIVLADTPKRPELRVLTERKNRHILRHLESSSAYSWRREVVQIDRVNRLSRLVSAEVDVAQRDNAPVILYPYGPKVFVFVAALALSRRYSLGGWLVCPIPRRYDVDYSHGSGLTMWFGLADVATGEPSRAHAGRS